MCNKRYFCFLFSIIAFFVYSPNQFDIFLTNHRQLWHEERYQLEPFLQTHRSIHADPYAQISIRLTILYSTTWTTTWWNLITNLQWNDPRRRTAILATHLRRSFHHLNLKSIEWVDGRENDRYGGLKKKENSPSKITWFITRLRRTMRKHFPPISVPLSQWKNTWQIKSKEKAMKLL